MFSQILIFGIYVVALISMKDTFGKREYKCKCGCIMEDYVWKSELSKHSVACFNCGTKLGVDNLNVKKAAQSAAIRTQTKNR